MPSRFVSDSISLEYGSSSEKQPWLKRVKVAKKRTPWNSPPKVNDSQWSKPYSSSSDLEKGSSSHSTLTEDDDDEDELNRRDVKKVAQVQPTLLLPITWTLSILVFVDMLAVSLVVPLLFRYYIAAGVSNANQRELLSSLFNMAQIAGGISLSILRDAYCVPSRTLLLASFVGSALSYAMIAYSSSLPHSSNWGIWILMVSRVLVGFVKQTMTVSTTLLTAATTKHDRAKYMGRLSASSTIAWIIGPSVGGILYKYVHPKAPPLLATALFVVNIFLLLLLLPQNNQSAMVDKDPSLVSLVSSTTSPTIRRDSFDSTKSKTPLTNIVSNLSLAFGSKELAAVVLAQLIMTFTTQATSVTQLGSFFEEMYKLGTHHRGYIASYQQLLQFFVQAMLVIPILNSVGGDIRATAYAMCFGLAVTDVLQAIVPFLSFYLVVVCPISSICSSMMKLSLSTLMTQISPQHSIFSVLAGVDILQNMVGVAVPFYRTLLFRLLAREDKLRDVLMEGDPDPQVWMISSGFHWLLGAILMTCLLLSSPLLFASSVESKKNKGG